MKHQQAACTCTPVFSYDNPPVRSLMLDVTCPIHGAPPTNDFAEMAAFSKASIVIAVPSGELVVEQEKRGDGANGIHTYGLEGNRRVSRVHVRASDLCASLGIAALPAGGAAPTYADGVRAALSAVATAKYDAESEGRAWSVRDVVVPGT